MNEHLFILGMNDSGTTFMQNALSDCVNCVSFRHPQQRPNGMEGQGVAYNRQKRNDWYPRDTDNCVTKVFSEKRHIWEDPKKFKWDKIRPAWETAWKACPNFAKANPKIFLEKTPMAIYAVDLYLEQYPDAKFIIMHRNPYAICEGMRRTIKKHKRVDYALDRCARHWVACSEKQRENIQQLQGRSVFIKYEELVTKPEKAAEKIKRLVPALHDVTFRKNVVCHSMDGAISRPVTNLNQRHLKNLSCGDYTELNGVLDGYPELLAYYKYVRRTKA